MSNSQSNTTENINTRCINAGSNVDDSNPVDEINVTPIREYVEVVINNKHGGFSLSKDAQRLYTERSGIKYDQYNRHACRHDPILIGVIKELGKDADRNSSTSLSVEKIPLEFKDCYRIDEYDGLETIDLSSHLLVGHLIKNMDVVNMYSDDADCQLLNLQKIMNTNYYSYKF